MSKLVMTIDSESETEAKLPTQKDKKALKSSKKQQQSIPTADEEDIMLNKEFQIEDENDFYKRGAAQVQRPDFANSKSVWNYADTVKQDKHHQTRDQYDEAEEGRGE